MKKEPSDSEIIEISLMDKAEVKRNKFGETVIQLSDGMTIVKSTAKQEKNSHRLRNGKMGSGAYARVKTAGIENERGGVEIYHDMVIKTQELSVKKFLDFNQTGRTLSGTIDYINKKTDERTKDVEKEYIFNCIHYSRFSNAMLFISKVYDGKLEKYYTKDESNKIGFLSHKKKKVMLGVKNLGLRNFHELIYTEDFKTAKIDVIKKYLIQLLNGLDFLNQPKVLKIIHSDEKLEEKKITGVVHRDIKLENIMMLDGHTPVFVDFGFSLFAGESVKTMLGTPWTMAPECVKHNEGLFKFSVAQDIFSLGVVFLQVLLQYYGKDYTELPHEILGENYKQSFTKDGRKIIIDCMLRFIRKKKEISDFTSLIEKMVEHDLSKRATIEDIRKFINDFNCGVVLAATPEKNFGIIDYFSSFFSPCASKDKLEDQSTGKEENLMDYEEFNNEKNVIQRFIFAAIHLNGCRFGFHCETYKKDQLEQICDMKFNRQILDDFSRFDLAEEIAATLLEENDLEVINRIIENLQTNKDTAHYYFGLLKESLELDNSVLDKINIHGYLKEKNLFNKRVLESILPSIHSPEEKASTISSNNCSTPKSNACCAFFTAATVFTAGAFTAAYIANISEGENESFGLY